MKNDWMITICCKPCHIVSVFHAHYCPYFGLWMAFWLVYKLFKNECIFYDNKMDNIIQISWKWDANSNVSVYCDSGLLSQFINSSRAHLIATTTTTTNIESRIVIYWFDLMLKEMAQMLPNGIQYCQNALDSKQWTILLPWENCKKVYKKRLSLVFFPYPVRHLWFFFFCLFFF